MRRAEPLPIAPKHGDSSDWNFANPTRFVQSWYPLVPARHVKPGRVLSHTAVGRRLAVFRTESGRSAVLDARCPHLGADLCIGTVRGERLRCAFHGWCISACGDIERSGRTKQEGDGHRAYPVLEKFGTIWFYNGPKPLFSLPEIASDLCRRLVLPSQRINCHPHLVLGNGLDLDHFDTLHNFEFTRPARKFSPGAYTLSIAIAGRLRSSFLRRLSGSNRSDIEATFSTIGASLALVEVTAPSRFTVLFTGKPEQGTCVTKTFLFLPTLRPDSVLRNLAILLVLLHSDRKVLDTIQFQPNFTARDEVLKQYARLVSSMPVG